MRDDMRCLHWWELRGEDDFDAPDTLIPPARSPDEDLRGEPLKKPSKATIHKPPLLDLDASGELRDVPVTELRALQESDELTSWAQRRLPAKNTLLLDDARIIEATYRSIQDTVLSTEELTSSDGSFDSGH